MAADPDTGIITDEKLTGAAGTENSDAAVAAEFVAAETAGGTGCAARPDVLHDLLHRLAARHLPSGRLHGADGSARLIVPQYGFADFADLAIGEIWHCGSDAAQVPGRAQRHAGGPVGGGPAGVPSRPPGMGGQD